MSDLYKIKKRTRIDSGVNKYVIIQVEDGNSGVCFVRSKKGVEFHQEIFENFKKKIRGIRMDGVKLKSSCSITCLGGGRIDYQSKGTLLKGYRGRKEDENLWI